MKSTLEDEKLKDKISESDRKMINDKCDEAIKWLDMNQTADKISESDRKMINDKCDEAIKWLDMNQTAEKDEYADKQKEIEGICNPIMTKLYQQAGGAPGDG